MPILVVTGDPGVGKTTVVMHVAEVLKQRGLKVGGVVSREVRRNNTRMGFEFIDLATNETATLASTTGSGPRIGKYLVDLTGCRFAVKVLKEADSCTGSRSAVGRIEEGLEGVQNRSRTEGLFEDDRIC